MKTVVVMLGKKKNPTMSAQQQLDWWGTSDSIISRRWMNHVFGGDRWSSFDSACWPGQSKMLIVVWPHWFGLMFTPRSFGAASFRPLGGCLVSLGPPGYSRTGSRNGSLQSCLLLLSVFHDGIKHGLILTASSEWSWHVEALEVVITEQ